MRRAVIIASVALLLVAGGSLWWLKAAPAPQGKGPPPSDPTIDAPTATPNIITVNTPTTVTFTVSIPEPTLNPASVNLLRVDPSGSTTVVARMVDNGQDGDETPGDKVFTAQLMPNVTSAEELVGGIYFQVSASFRGMIRRVGSQTLLVPIWAKVTAGNLFTLSMPSSFHLVDESKPNPYSSHVFVITFNGLKAGYIWAYTPQQWVAAQQAEEYPLMLYPAGDFVYAYALSQEIPDAMTDIKTQVRLVIGTFSPF